MRFQFGQSPWKNQDDEILKAAVMKYGLNQWGRVASLFAKRTAKQCQARWNEWLDPRIRKTDWSRDEDERLLHLAKLFPSQWRTIGPMIGRTAVQCLERYERLLDQAEGGAALGEEDGTTTTTNRFESGIEHRAAKPDAVDLNAEETEMQSEARARLANIKGKKAKRKERERQLEEAKRIAVVQRRREAKLAGQTGRSLETRSTKRRRKNSDAEEIDYTVEVPFEQLAPATGPHDVTTESLETLKRAQDQAARLKRLQDIKAKADAEREGRERRRKARAEETEKTTDGLLRKMREEQSAAQRAVEIALGPRKTLALPAPGVRDEELEVVARIVGGERRAAPPGAAQYLPSLASRRTFAAVNNKRPLRDDLGINRHPQEELEEEEDHEDVAEAEDLQDLERRRLVAKLGSLPAPEYDVAIEGQMEDVEEEDSDEADAAPVIEDSGKRDERLKRERIEERNRRLATRPRAVQLNLPPLAPTRAPSGGVAGARGLIEEELERMLTSEDRVEIPPVHPDLAREIELSRASCMKELETTSVARVFAERDRAAPSAAMEAQARRKADALKAANDRRAEAYAAETAELTEREKKVKEKIAALTRKLMDARVDLEAFNALASVEAARGAARLESVKEEVQRVASVEAELQREWASKTRR